ncbi:hypothetical protein F5Y15DRAFT_80752 [Xylariaceae sp. FL0016]|nr:hypothetical protein F5Y15DRAFT_80752 [Xylariaceae sp. FL0016]
MRRCHPTTQDPDRLQWMKWEVRHRNPALTSMDGLGSGREWRDFRMAEASEACTCETVANKGVARLTMNMRRWITRARLGHARNHLMRQRRCTRSQIGHTLRMDQGNAYQVYHLGHVDNGTELLARWYTISRSWETSSKWHISEECGFSLQAISVSQNASWRSLIGCRTPTRMLQPFFLFQLPYLQGDAGSDWHCASRGEWACWQHDGLSGGIRFSQSWTRPG